MTITAHIKIEAQDILGSLRKFLEDILNTGEIQAVLVPQHLPMKNLIMPTLVTEPDRLEGVDPLAPAFPINAAKIVSRLTRKPMGGKLAAVLRPCEIRSFVELVKLKQGRMEDVVLIGIDCLGAFQNKDYFRFAEGDRIESTLRFYRTMLQDTAESIDDFELAPACLACPYPVAENADIAIGLYGMDIDQACLVQSQSEAGEQLLRLMELSAADVPPARSDAIQALVSKRIAYREEMFVRTREATDSLEKISAYFATCVNCYNCRVACPVCYCKECVFVTDVFNHDPVQYLRWANRKGIIKMPTDTLFYHITRLAHMSTACVGCGQCSNACPNDIPVMELFQTVAHKTQQAFDYEAGQSIEQEPPLSVFREDEFPEVVGIQSN